ncbi:MAG: ATP synthase F1 subunit delta [Coriobacteriales bacterium]
MPKDRTLIKREITTYAQVLVEAAKAQGNILEVAGQLKEVQEAYLRYPQLREALNDESLPASAYAAVLEGVLEGFDANVVKTLTVMAERHEMSLLHRFVSEYELLAEDALNMVILDVTTVVELDDAMREAIKSKYAAQFGKDVMLREHIDPSIVGGIVLGARGKRIDASVSTLLEQVRVALSSVKTGGER